MANEKGKDCECLACSLFLAALIWAGALALNTHLWSVWPGWCSPVLGLLVTAVTGEIILGPLLDYIKGQMKSKMGGYAEVIPSFCDGDEKNSAKWHAIVSDSGGGIWIGRFERILFFGAAYVSAWAIVGGWLALKVASKWESWKVVGDIAGADLANPKLDFYVARRQWATLGYVGFLIGTLTNGFVAYVCVLIARWPT